MLDLIRSVSHGKGVNVLVSSHLLPDVERVCDQVMVLFRGKLRAVGQIQELKKIEGAPVDVELREPSGAWLNAALTAGVKLLSSKGQSYRIQAPGTPAEVARLVFRSAQETGAQVRGFKVAERSLEDAFMEAIQ